MDLAASVRAPVSIAALPFMVFSFPLTSRAQEDIMSLSSCTCGWLWASRVAVVVLPKALFIYANVNRRVWV